MEKGHRDNRPLKRIIGKGHDFIEPPPGAPIVLWLECGHTVEMKAKDYRKQKRARCNECRKPTPPPLSS